MLQPFSTEAGVLKHAWIELTYKCDLECVHCYNDSGPTRPAKSPLSRGEYADLLEKLKELGCRSVQFIGGEPTLHPHLADFVGAAARLGFDQIEVFSNLTHLSEKLISALQGANARVACSFYSDLANVHDAITTKKGSQRRTLKNIVRLIDAKVPVRVGIVAIKGLNDDRLCETRQYLEVHGVSNIKVDDARAIGRSGTENLDRDGILPELCGRCADGSVCIDPDGNVSPCIMSRVWKLGTVRESTIDAMLGSRSWNEFARLLGAVQASRSKGPGCSPEDNCNPGACHPQIDGPPDCMPQTSCAPDVLPDD
jgi:radical SAM protein with 4Fe4S-binding SPASM domain